MSSNAGVGAYAHSTLSTLSPLTVRTTTRKTHSDFPFTVPTAKTDKFNSNAVILALRHLEHVARANRKAPQPQTRTPASLQHIQHPVTLPQKGTVCPNPWFKEPNRLWQRYDLHRAACNKWDWFHFWQTLYMLLNLHPKKIISIYKLELEKKMLVTATGC